MKKLDIKKILKIQKPDSQIKTETEKISIKIENSKSHFTPQQSNNKKIDQSEQRSDFEINLQKNIEIEKKEEIYKKKLLKLNLEHGNCWTKIASFFPNKCEKDIKNDFFCLIRKSLRTACKSLGRKDGSDLLRKIKPKTCSQFLTKEISIDLREIEGENCDPKFLNVNLYEFVKKFAFLKFNLFLKKIGKRDIFVIKKCLDYLIELDCEIYNIEENKKNDDFIFLKNNDQIFEDFENFIFKKKMFLEDFENKNSLKNNDDFFKKKYIFHLENLNSFIDGLMDKIENSSLNKIKFKKDEIIELFNDYQKNIHLEKNKNDNMMNFENEEENQILFKNNKKNLNFEEEKYLNSEKMKKNLKLMNFRKSDNILRKNIKFERIMNFCIKKKKKIRKIKNKNKIKNNFNLIITEEELIFKNFLRKKTNFSLNEISHLFTNQIQKTSYKIYHIYTKQLQRKNNLIINHLNNYFVQERYRESQDDENATKSKLSSFDDLFRTY